MNILHLYYHYSRHNWLQSAIDNFECFEKYSHHRIHYCNIAYGIPRYIAKRDYDLIFIHTSIPSILRWTDFSFEKLVGKMQSVIHHPAPKVLFCQDEFFKMGLVVKLIERMNVSHVFSVANQDQWDTIYGGIDKQNVTIHSVLTGYLDSQIVSKVQSIAPPPRNIDLGYRATNVPAWLGRHGKLKVDIAKIVDTHAKKMGLVTDIKLASQQSDYIHGFDWYRFLLQCKGVIGVEGGSSLLDVDGSLVKTVESYSQKHPSASYEEIESKCFRGMDGNLKLFALSPRHLEACLTKTCQILVEGDYNDILKPNVHYIPLKKDFSNLDEALEIFSHEEKRQEIVQNAYRDIVESGAYTYEAFVNHVFQCLPSSNPSLFSAQFTNSRDKFLKYRTQCELTVAHMLPTSFQEKLKQILRGQR